MSSTSKKIFMAMMAITELSSSVSKSMSMKAQPSVSTRLISKLSKQAKITKQAKSVSVKQKIEDFVSKKTDKNERRNLQYGRAGDHHSHHDGCSNVFHESHDWWAYDHAAKLDFDVGQWIPNRDVGVEYCDIRDGGSPSQFGGYGAVCGCPWAGHKGLVLRNMGVATIDLIEVSLEGPNGQIGCFEKEDLAFGPGEELKVMQQTTNRCTDMWDWTGAERLLINGEYKDPMTGKLSGFLFSPIHICDHGKNPIGTHDTVHQNNKEPAHADEDIKLAIVAVFDAEHPDQDLCHDGLKQCSLMASDDDRPYNSHSHHHSH